MVYPECSVEPGDWADESCDCQLLHGHHRVDEVTIHECMCGNKWYDDGNEVW